MKYHQGMKSAAGYGRISWAEVAYSCVIFLWDVQWSGARKDIETTSVHCLIEMKSNENLELELKA